MSTEDVEQRALAAAAQERTDQAARATEYERKEAQRNTDEGQASIALAIRAVEEILDYRTTRSDWKVTWKILGSAGYEALITAHTTLSGVDIRHQKFPCTHSGLLPLGHDRSAGHRETSVLCGDPRYGGRWQALTLGSFGEALEKRRRGPVSGLG
jgi:hypothetical protein